MINKKIEPEKTVRLRLAEASEAEAIHALMVEVYDGLSFKDIYSCDDLENVRRYLNNGGFGVVGVNKDGRIVSSLICQFPGTNPDNLGLDTGLSKEELLRVAHFESAVVHPAYRGQGLEGRMIVFAEEHIDRNRYDIFFGTVSPDNPASCHTAEKNGFECLLTKEKYGGLIRRIYCKRV